MTDAKIKRSELDKWTVFTRTCVNLEMAEDVALEFTQQKQSRVAIWPMKSDRWMVIVQYPTLMN